MGRRGGERRRRGTRRGLEGLGVDRSMSLQVRETREEHGRTMADAETAIYLEILWADLSWLNSTSHLHYIAAHTYCNTHCFIQPVVTEYTAHEFVYTSSISQFVGLRCFISAFSQPNFMSKI